MLADPTPGPPHSKSARGAAGETQEARPVVGPKAPSSRRVRWLAFLAGLSLVLVYALRGGSYDIVVFEEHGVVIWWIAAVGFACGLLPRTRPSRTVLVLVGAMFAYAGWTALSLTWTESAERTTEEIARALDYLGIVVLIAATLDRQTWRPAAAGIAFGALAVCVIAVASRLQPALFGHDPVITSLHINRLSYPFGYWNAVGAWAAMSVCIGLAWSVHQRDRVQRALALALVPTAASTAYLTYSRAAAAGLALGVVLVLATSRNRISAALHAGLAAFGSAIAILAIRSAPAIADATGTHGAAGVAAALIFAAAVCGVGATATAMLHTDRWSVPRRIGRPVGIAAALAALVAVGAVGPVLVKRGWHSFSHPVLVTSADPAARLTNLSSTRYYVWKAAIHAFDAKPATGTGAGTFGFWWNRHATTYEYLHDTHNIWLQNMAELGAPGLLLIVAVALALLGTGTAVHRRARRRASAGVGVAFLAATVVFLLQASVDWMWESTAVTVLALAGVAAAAGRLNQGRFALSWPGRLVLVVVAVIAGAVQIPGLLSTAELRRSQAAERQGHGALALSWANAAVSAEPWSASAYEQRGLVMEAGGRLETAAADLSRAISHERTNFTHWLILARIQTERGLLAEAVRDYRQAHRLRPDASVFTFAPYFRIK
ncbi:MAG: O-antigen ligase family protein [Solirubrobacteraceae bacterium]